MSKTYADIITEARVMLQDEEAPQRYSDTKLYAILNRALNEMSRIRPDAFYDFYDANELNVPEIIGSGTAATGQVLATTAFGLEMQFYNPLVAYVTAVTELADDEYSNDGRAVALLQEFRKTILGV